MSTVLITGCSSGFGQETARLFLQQGWQVIATMRTPNPDALPASDRLRILPLDITDPASIAALVEAAGPIDVLVNNAGIGAPVPVELMPTDTARALFETNLFGTLAMTQAFVPQFRARRAGVVVNVTSTVTLKALPLVGVYSASKAAVNAFTASLAIEMEPFSVRVRLVLPGRSPETRFGANAQAFLHGQDHPDYAESIARIIAGLRDGSGPVTHAGDVAQAVWRAATDANTPLRIPAGADAEAWMAELGGRA
ncbi:dehydrogenase [Stenotrophomonas panacihumi]|uniref:Dehydrogenase n=1 Tax=Stenotrophomonas panacihumi TaxID=676599 RepID=A0A0R0AEN6_9GAMM|nr:SDR family oxidoreductase [Stenotrophomonas panacihumi]KRG43263.1 dehydrogenase [Stenotrophomonas panacihumi]PTN55686.1 SDR family NAD(P)-dependent oxidoreductase [Stenotrophomonas panacihumi]